METKCCKAGQPQIEFLIFPVKIISRKCFVSFHPTYFILFKIRISSSIYSLVLRSILKGPLPNIKWKNKASFISKSSTLLFRMNHGYSNSSKHFNFLYNLLLFSKWRWLVNPDKICKLFLPATTTSSEFAVNWNDFTPLILQHLKQFLKSFTFHPVLCLCIICLPGSQILPYAATADCAIKNSRKSRSSPEELTALRQSAPISARLLAPWVALPSRNVALGVGSHRYLGCPVPALM